ncbi:hypothetical protein CALCODRAFT_480545 [Calocera cornea HHB12733]|uniref:BZIP domain-containing protein n=1 Tax=Calocera cornea HHB12733 TaxID=1353952 RepID=A0A165IJF0_9BASI|nr:hypothetical protein CALCODRAFT_480545 [Calocera cornea HHB12733]
MPSRSQPIPQSRAASELLGLSGNYLHMRQVPHLTNARIDQQIGRNIAQSLKSWQQPGDVDAPLAVAFDEIIQADSVAEELSAAFEDQDSPFASSTGTSESALPLVDLSTYMWCARSRSPSPDSGATAAYLQSYTNDGSFSELAVSPHDLLFPWNLSSQQQPHVLPAPAVKSAPAPAPAPTPAAPTPAPRARSKAKSQAALTLSESPSSAAGRTPASPSVSATPLSEAHTSSRPLRGKRRIGLDAPIQQRTYHGPSRTSLRTLPRGFEKNLEPEKVAGFKRAIEAVEEGDADEDDKDIIDTVTHRVMQKRVKNTLAARKSRARRAEYLDQLERRLAEKNDRVQELERELREKDTEIRVLKGLMYGEGPEDEEQEQEMDD